MQTPEPVLTLALPLLLALACGDKEPADPGSDTGGSPVDTAGVTDSAAGDDTGEDCDAPTRWYYDADGDGHGDVTAAIEACDQPAGYVAQAGDCDDIDGDVHPGGTEVCNGRDDDCDDLVDDDDEVEGQSTWYADIDGDGWGDEAAWEEACEAAADQVATAGDCDDAEALANPGLDEVCGDGIDNDCDGTPNSCAVPASVTLADSDVVLWGSRPSQLAGTAVAGRGDVDGDGQDDLLVGSPGDAYNTGLAHLVLGPVTAGAGLDDVGISLNGAETSEQLGSAVSFVPDIDGDGYDEVLVGAVGYNGGTGAAYFAYGPISSTRAAYWYDTFWDGESVFPGAGHTVTAADLDADGIAEVIVGAAEAAHTATSPGGVHVLFGADLESGFDDSLPTVGITFEGGDLGDLAGYGLGTGDVDGDGIADLLMGGPGAANADGDSFSGAAWLYLGPISGGRDTSDADASVQGAAYPDQLGTAVAVTADMDGDGTGEVVVGAPYASDAAGYGGVVYVFDGAGFFGRDDAVATIAGTTGSSYLGLRVAPAGDPDKDGSADLLVAAGGTSPGGSAYLFRGPLSGALDTTDADIAYLSSDSADQVGAAIGSAGDLDGDGSDEVVIGAPGVDGVGEVYVLGWDVAW